MSALSSRPENQAKKELKISGLSFWLASLMLESKLRCYGLRYVKQFPSVQRIAQMSQTWRILQSCSDRLTDFKTMQNLQELEVENV